MPDSESAPWWSKYPDADESERPPAAAPFPSTDPRGLDVLTRGSTTSPPQSEIDLRLLSAFPQLLARTPPAMPLAAYPAAASNLSQMFGMFGRGPMSNLSIPFVPMGSVGSSASFAPLSRSSAMQGSVHPYYDSTLAYTPRPGGSGAGRSVLSDNQIRNIIFNETRGLQPDFSQGDAFNPNILAAREELADTIMNADRVWGPAVRFNDS